jgi:hypothetical protein
MFVFRKSKSIPLSPLSRIHVILYNVPQLLALLYHTASGDKKIRSYRALTGRVRKEELAPIKQEGQRDARLGRL